MRFNYRGNHIKASTIYEAQAMTRQTKGLVRFVMLTKETHGFKNGTIIDFVDKTKDGFVIRPFNNGEWFACIPYANGKEI